MTRVLVLRLARKNMAIMAITSKTIQKLYKLDFFLLLLVLFNLYVKHSSTFKQFRQKATKKDKLN